MEVPALTCDFGWSQGRRTHDLCGQTDALPAEHMAPLLDSPARTDRGPASEQKRRLTMEPRPPGRALRHISHSRPVKRNLSRAAASRRRSGRAHAYGSPGRRSITARRRPGLRGLVLRASPRRARAGSRRCAQDGAGRGGLAEDRPAAVCDGAEAASSATGGRQSRRTCDAGRAAVAPPRGCRARAPCRGRASIAGRPSATSTSDSPPPRRTEVVVPSRPRILGELPRISASVALQVPA